MVLNRSGQGISDVTMHIHFLPMRRDDRAAIEISGEALVIDGERFDFAALPVGATLPRGAIACDWIGGDVTRDADGALRIPLILPHGADAPEAIRFPDPVTVRADGPLPLPSSQEPAA